MSSAAATQSAYFDRTFNLYNVRDLQAPPSDLNEPLAKVAARAVIESGDRRFALTPDGKELWVTCELSGEVYIIDRKEFAVQGKIEFLPPGMRKSDVTPVDLRITIRNLLNMTSGIYDFPADEQFMKEITADPLMPFSPDDVIAILRRNKPNFEPGAEVVDQRGAVVAGVEAAELVHRVARAAQLVPEVLERLGAVVGRDREHLAQDRVGGGDTLQHRLDRRPGRRLVAPAPGGNCDLVGVHRQRQRRRGAAVAQKPQHLGQVADLRAQGYATVAALENAADPISEARRLGCAHILRDTTLLALD